MLVVRVSVQMIIRGRVTRKLEERKEFANEKTLLDEKEDLFC